MDIRTFTRADLGGAKEALRSAFYNEGSDALFNEWEFAERLLGSDGYIEALCVVAVEGRDVIGYNALTKAEIGGRPGLALGPLGVCRARQNAGVGTALVRACIQRAASAGYPWIALLGGDYYARFGFEKAAPYGVTVSEDAFENAHLQILFLDDAVKSAISGKLTYCDAFYDADGRLL